MEKIDTRANAVIVTERTTNWNAVDWRRARKVVRNLRRRIFKATREGNKRKVRALQRLLLRSYSNILLSVRRATQENKGKNTPGIDKLLVKTPEARGALVDVLAKFIPWKPLPTKRVYIKKKSGKLRPLSIPSIIDRCLQGIVKQALEPHWEAKFEGISYGFRPGRAAHDALEEIFVCARSTGIRPWILDADIKGCFDNINHDKILQLIGNFPARILISQWLKSGYIDNNVFQSSEAGVPQGGIISPLLANIALHGMESALGITIKTRKDGKEEKRGEYRVTRYADDFIILCQTRKAADLAKCLISKFLSDRGLRLSEEKTKIVHLEEGFDFLGWNIRRYQDKRCKRGVKLLTKPSKESVKKVKEQIREVIRKYRNGNIKALITKLNEVIRGWANYHKTAVSSEIFHNLDNWMWVVLSKVAKRRHPKKTKRWCKRKYFGRFNPSHPRNKWVFGDLESGIYVQKFAWFNIERHTKIKGLASPDDPFIQKYWEKRRRTLAQKRAERQINSKLRRNIMKRQEYKCSVCGDSLFNGEEYHLHHILPKCEGGGDELNNLTFVHLYCHQQLHHE